MDNMPENSKNKIFRVRQINEWLAFYYRYYSFITNYMDNTKNT